MEFQKIPIACPRCKRIVIHWNGITKMPMTSRCSCGASVTFDPVQNKAKVSKYNPQRAESSGKRFY